MYEVYFPKFNNNPAAVRKLLVSISVTFVSKVLALLVGIGTHK